MRSAKRIDANTAGLAPAGFYFARVTQNLRGVVTAAAPAPNRQAAAPIGRAKRTEVLH
jgi:hypothetical protein